MVYHLYTIYLFARSDFKTIVVPSTLFGVINSLATRAYGLDDSSPITFSLLLSRLTQSLFWVCLVFIPFAINNQRNPSAIAEDKINKPWRPLPQNRLSPFQAKCIMYFLAALVPIHGYVCNGIGFRQSLFLRALDIWYNNIGGGDNSPILRNLINALGYLCFTTGALEIALGKQLRFTLEAVSSYSGAENHLIQWLLVIAGIIFTTVHLQDLYDQVGDAARDRRTIPLVIGDGPTRWTIAIPMLVWGVICPRFWGLAGGLLSLSIGLAYTVALRVLLVRGGQSDRMTFRLWNCWISTIYVMPLFVQE
ncbi:hypothetical protein P170DRAFT_446081 [Aspergillus steynii IBT 23096]|uniref:UbiA prenyltransferase n=1 Tax=Aspergillus steynii IBT 23096 TaxID=1392250 RepID=A0A2I2GDA9_9EURO|nr:uncharacterized protein P170DRAFT_446081 [Aspergillus steynii IBT 23096]PLB50875.1 hypothetical protein P170DRAFT_446081 [Aspergillus steynii IBT 23096]